MRWGQIVRYVWLAKLSRRCWVVVQSMMEHIVVICTQSGPLTTTPLGSMVVVRRDRHVHVCWRPSVVTM